MVETYIPQNILAIAERLPSNFTELKAIQEFTAKLFKRNNEIHETILNFGAKQQPYSPEDLNYLNQLKLEKMIVGRDINYLNSRSVVKDIVFDSQKNIIRPPSNDADKIKKEYESNVVKITENIENMKKTTPVDLTKTGITKNMMIPILVVVGGLIL